MKTQPSANSSLTALAASCLLAAYLNAPAASTNLNPVADTSLQDAFPNNNFGGGTTFTAGGRNKPGLSRALLQFDIAGKVPAGAVINSAALTLTIFAANGPDSTFNLNRVLAACGEGTGDPGSGSPAAVGEATWNDRLGPGTPWATAGGDFTATVSASQAVGSGGSVTFAAPGLAADIQAWLDHPGTNFGWMLRSQSETTAGTIRRFLGRLDTIAPPVLAVDYTVSTPPAAPNLFGLARAGNRIRFSFNAQAGRSYTVEYRDALTNGSWNPVTNIPTLSANSTLHITNAISATEGYFRARTP